MRKNKDYKDMENALFEKAERLESGVNYSGAVRDSINGQRVKREKTGTALPFGLRLAGGFLVAALVGGSVFGALKYAEYRGSLIVPGSDTGLDSVYTEYGPVTSFNEDVQPYDTTLPSPDEPDKNVCFFKEVTVIDPAADWIVTNPDLPPQLEGGAVAEIRNEHVSELGYGIYTDGRRLIIVDKDGAGVVKEFMCGDELFPLIIAETDYRQPDGVTFGQLIVTEDKDTGKVTFIHTRFAGYSGFYGGTTLVEYFDTQTKETGAIGGYLPESAVEYVRSGGYLGTYELAKLSAEDTANGKTIGCTCTVVPIGRGNNETQEDFFAGYLRYDNGNYYFGEPYDIGDDGADTTDTGTDTEDPGTEFKGEYGLAVECDNEDAYPPLYASRVYKGADLISQKTDEAKAFICQITRDEYLNDLLPLHSVIRKPWAVISVEVGDKMFESITEAEEWIKDRIRLSSSTVNGFEITVTVTWDTVTVPGSDSTAVLPAAYRTEYSYRFTANYRILHNTVPADERVLIEYADGKLRFTRIAAEPEFTVAKNGDWKASEIDIHKLFAMLDGHDALDDPWDLVPSVTLRMMLDGETIYAFEMSYDGAVNVMRYHGSGRSFVASMKLTANEIKTLSGESGHDATETTAPATETTAPVQEDPAYAEQTDAVMKELKTWLTGKLYDGMNITDLLINVGSVKGDGATLKARIIAEADLEVHNEEDGVFLRAGDKAYDFSVFSLHDDRSTVFETRLFVYPGAEGFDMPFGLTPDMTPAEALEAMGYGTDAHTIRVNDGNTSFCLDNSGSTLVLSLSVIGEETAVSLYYELGGGSNVNIEFGHIKSVI